MIRILALVFKSRGDSVPFITPADFFVDGDTEEVQTLVDSISSQADQDKLRQIAQRNLDAVRSTGVTVPHARELISAIWMRSLSPGKVKGGSPRVLHLDITRTTAIDDNAFEAELALLVENSVNIHGDQVPDGPLSIGMNENPRSKVRAFAKNDKLWDVAAIPAAGMTVYPGKDITHIRETLRHIFTPDTVESPSRIVILGLNWQTDPWSDVDEFDKPAKWDRPVLLVIPEQIVGDSADIGACLGAWLANHVQKRRNTIRFLLPAKDAQGMFSDRELVYSARCSFLCSKKSWGNDDVYRNLFKDFDNPLRQALKTRFNRVAILKQWNFQQPHQCVFDIEKLTAKQGSDIPSAVEAKILTDIFDHRDFRNLVLDRTKDGMRIGDLMDDLMEPPPPHTGEAIPFLGETKLFELILGIAAAGDIVLNVEGTWIGRQPQDASDEEALEYIRKKAFRSDQENRKAHLGLPGAGAGGTITISPENSGVSAEPIPAASPPVSTTGPVEVFPPEPPADNSSGSGAGEGESEWTPPPEPPAIVINNRKSVEAATGINLSGSFEAWGIPSDRCIDNASISFAGLTVQQIRQVLQRIPSTFKATLDITYKESDE
jgi:hypothetical protein